MKALKIFSVLLLIAGTAVAGELKPGMKINKENVNEFKDLLPEPVVKRILKGEYEIKVGEISGDMSKVYVDSFYSASSKNAGRFKLDKKGGIVDVKTGKRIRLPYGLPFPNIDPNDPQAGAKIMWNFYATEFQTNTQEAMWTLKTLKGKTVEVEVVGRVTRFNVDFNTNPNVKGVQKGITYMEIAQYLAPADLFGTVVLTWRWQEPEKWDTTWTYSPTIRRVRRTTSANRSDPVGPTDYILDDVNGYSGKVEFFKWKFIGEKEMLVPFIPDEPDGFVATFPRKAKEATKYGKQAFQQPRYEIKWSYDDPKSKLAPWWPLNWVWVKRPVYLVEGTSKDPYYSIGRQIMIVDKDTFRIHIKLGWDRSGDYWRTQVMNQSYYISPYGDLSASAAEISFVVDEKRNRASISSRVDKKVTPTIFNLEVEPSTFSSSNFLNYGK